MRVVPHVAKITLCIVHSVLLVVLCAPGNLVHIMSVLLVLLVSHAVYACWSACPPTSTCALVVSLLCAGQMHASCPACPAGELWLLHAWLQLPASFALPHSPPAALRCVRERQMHSSVHHAMVYACSASPCAFSTTPERVVTAFPLCPQGRKALTAL